MNKSSGKQNGDSVVKCFTTTPIDLCAYLDAKFDLAINQHIGINTPFEEIYQVTKEFHDRLFDGKEGEKSEYTKDLLRDKKAHDRYIQRKKKKLCHHKDHYRT